MKIPQILTLIHENPSDSYVDPSIPLILPILGKEKSPNSFEIQGFTSFFFLKKWCHQESNRGHKDFQSFALPTELWHLA